MLTGECMSCVFSYSVFVHLCSVHVLFFQESPPQSGRLEPEQLFFIAVRMFSNIAPDLLLNFPGVASVVPWCCPLTRCHASLVCRHSPSSAIAGTTVH
jgi:hypothetical protein